MKIMAVDYGDSRTGLAVCDRTEFLASPVGVLEEKNRAKLLEKLVYASREYDVKEVVIGLPKNMNGTEGPRAEKCRRLATELGNILDIPVRLWDERSSTVTAHQILSGNDVYGKKRKQTVDGVAAAIILESYLAYRKNVAQKEGSGE